jgi:hypothetical protein
MQNKNWQSFAVLLSLCAIIFIIYTCSSGHNAYHDGKRWGTEGHKEDALAGTELCKNCHGEDFFGGTSGIDCYDCHFGPTGKYEPSDVAGILGIAPADDIQDAASNDITTSSLPNVAVNTYVYLRAKSVDSGTTPAWSLSARPSGSSAALSAQDVEFTVNFKPDVKGFYVIDATVTQSGTAVSDSIVIYANRWAGASKCSTCHSGIYTTWQTTHHSNANDRRLENYFNGGFYQDYCQECLSGITLQIMR